MLEFDKASCMQNKRYVKTFKRWTNEQTLFIRHSDDITGAKKIREKNRDSDVTIIL